MYSAMVVQVQVKHLLACIVVQKDVLNPDTPYEKVYIVRSLVSTREIGFLPGDHEDKAHFTRFLIRTW